MIRPIYETPESLSAEEKFLQLLKAPLRCSSVTKVRKKFYPIDAIAKLGHFTVAFIEAKCRSNNINAYPTYMLSLDKFQNGAWLAECFNADYIIAVQWADCCGLWRWRDHRIDRPQIQIGGRTDRGDEQDVEPVIHIPILEFERFA